MANENLTQSFSSKKWLGLPVIVYLTLGGIFGLGSTKWLESPKKPIPLVMGTTIIIISSVGWPGQLAYSAGVRSGTLSGR